MRPTFTRWRLAASLAAAAVAAAGLILSGAAQQALATTVTQAGPFPVGNLLNYANSDIESAGFNWAADLNQASNDVASIGQDGTTSLMHGHSLAVVASGAGTLVYKLGNGQDNTSAAITLPATGGEYRVGAYMKVAAGASQHTVEFDLACYDSSGTWIGWVTGAPVTMNTGGTWQYVEDDFLASNSRPLPSNCAQVQGSPRVEVTGMHAGGTVHMDDVIFAPYRAALAIGAHGENCQGCAYTGAEWYATDQVIGPDQPDKALQTDKEFNTGLPASFSDTNCAQDEAQLTSAGLDSSAWPACIITYKTPVTSTNGVTSPAMDSFLQGVPPQQEIILVWHQEPEGDTFTAGDLPGCATVTPVAKAFTCETGLQAGYVHNSASDTPNVLIAQDSAGSYYLNNTDCSWITPSSATGQGVDLYLVDHYENRTVNGSNVNGAVNASEWQNWLNCASQENRPLGFGEYGLDDSPTGPASLCDHTATNAQELPNALIADNAYLAQLPMSADPSLRNPAPFVVWDYWFTYYGGTAVCTVFDNEFGAIDIWRGIQTQNGGG